LDLEYENIGAGLAREAEMLPPVPTGPAAADMPPVIMLVTSPVEVVVNKNSPPTVTLPPLENALTASSELSTITTSVRSMVKCQHTSESCNRTPF
jgi:hypothetical protein